MAKAKARVDRRMGVRENGLEQVETGSRHKEEGKVQIHRSRTGTREEIPAYRQLNC
jgi:hypothetical protein